MLKRYGLLIIAIFMIFIAQQEALAQEDSLQIVTTTTQATDLVTILSEGADGITITGLMGSGVDPHLYQPTVTDIEAMNDADMIIYSGLHLEGQFDEVFEALQEQGVLIYALSQPVKDAGFVIGGFNADTETLGTDDPHFWFDPRNWELTTMDLAQTLAEIDPDDADIYLSNAETYIEQLQLLYTWANEGMRSVDEDQRYLVTSHDAFQYFGAAFGWRMESIQGISTQDEAGVGDIQQTVDFVLEHQIPVMFIESSVSPGTIEAVIEAVEDEGSNIQLGLRVLYSDAMGDFDTFGGTYIGMIAQNVYTILQSYQCGGIEITIPEWPEDLNIMPPENVLMANCN